MSVNIQSLIDQLNSKLVTRVDQYTVLPIPQTKIEWQELSKNCPDTPSIWLHIGHGTSDEVVVLRIGNSTPQNTTNGQWNTGFNAIRHVLMALNSPTRDIILSRPNDFDFYQQAQRLFVEQNILLLYFSTPSLTQIESIYQQLCRLCLPLYSRAHPKDGTPMFGKAAYNSRLILDTLLDTPRVMLSDIIQSKAPPSNPIESELTSKSRTPPHILFSAFLLSIQRTLRDESKWRSGKLLGSLQGFDPQGAVLLLAAGSEHTLVQRFIQLVKSPAHQKHWKYEYKNKDEHPALYIPRFLRAGFGPQVKILISKENSEYFHIIGLSLYRVKSTVADS